MEYMEHRKLFVGGLSREITEDTLREYFSKYGTVEETLVIRCRVTGHGRGFGFVIFTDSSMADEALRHNNHVILGRKVDVKQANPKEDKDKEKEEQSNENSNVTVKLSTKKIFVGGLPPDITEDEFKSYFDRFGMITDAVVIFDKETHRPRGFGFITYDSEDAVDNVLKNRYHELKNKMVEVKRAEPKDNNDKNMNCYEPQDMNDNYMSCYDCYNTGLDCCNTGLDFGCGFSYGNNDIYSSFNPCYYPAFQTTSYYHSWNPCVFGGWESPLSVTGSHLNGYSSNSSHAVPSYASYSPFGISMNGWATGGVDLTNHQMTDTTANVTTHQRMADTTVNSKDYSGGVDEIAANTKSLKIDDLSNLKTGGGMEEIAANTKSLKIDDLSNLKTSCQGGEPISDLLSSKNRAEIHISTAQEAVPLSTKTEQNGES